jgi:hypothetical protein
MAVSHEHVARADDGIFCQAIGAVDCYMFAEGISISDAQPRRFTAVFHILRSIPEHTTGMNDVSFAHGQVTGQMDLRTDYTSGAERHVGVDHGIRSNIHVLAKDSAWGNDSGGVDARTHEADAFNLIWAKSRKLRNNCKPAFWLFSG